MKTIQFIFAIMLSVVCHGQTISVLTYNIRYGLANDGENSWQFRKEGLGEQLKFYAPDIFGVQEALKFQVDFLDSLLTEYDYYGVGRDDGENKGEFSAIFYKSGLFEVNKEATFWLSESPETASTGWDAALPRICSYILIKHKQAGKSFFIFNTHFDHVGVEARNNSAKLIIQKISEINDNDYPLLLMGDFNLEPDSEAIQLISSSLNDAKKVSKKVVFGPEGTFNGFDYHHPMDRRIDYIFTDQRKTDVIKYGVLTDSKNTKFYSDHLPVFVEVNLK